MRLTSVATLAAAVGSAIAAPLSDITSRQAGSVGTSGAPQEPNIPENVNLPPLPDKPEILPLPQNPEVPQLPTPEGSANMGGQLQNATSPPATPIAQKFLFSDIIQLILDKLPELIEAAQAFKTNGTTGGYSVTTATITKKRSDSPRQVGATDDLGILKNLPALLQAAEGSRGDSASTVDQGNNTEIASSLTSRQVVDGSGILAKLPALLEAIEAAKGGVLSTADQSNTTAAVPSISPRQSRPVDVAGLLQAIAAEGGSHSLVEQGNTTAVTSTIASRQVSPVELAATLQQLPQIIDSIESKKGNYTNPASSKQITANVKAQGLSARQIDVADILQQLPAVLEALNKQQESAANATSV